MNRVYAHAEAGEPDVYLNDHDQSNPFIVFRFGDEIGTSQPEIPSGAVASQLPGPEQLCQRRSNFSAADDKLSCSKGREPPRQAASPVR